MASTAEQNAAALDASFEALDALSFDSEATRQAPQSKKDKDGKKKAKLGSAQGVMVGLATGVLFGPAVGIAMGTSRAISLRNERQGVLDELGERENALRDTIDIQQEQIDANRKSSQGNPENLRQVEFQQRMLDGAKKWGMTAGGGPKSAQLFDALRTSFGTFLAKDEEQKIAADLQKEADIRLADKTEYDRWAAANNNYVARSQPQMDQRYFGNLTIDLVQRNQGVPVNTVDLMLAVTGLAKTIAPTEAVMSDDRQAAAGLGSIFDSVERLVNKHAKDGSPFLDKELKFIESSVRTILGHGDATQRALDARATKFALEDTPAFADRFNIAGSMVPIMPPRVVQEEEEELITPNPTRDGGAAAVPPKPSAHSVRQNILGTDRPSFKLRSPFERTVNE